MPAVLPPDPSLRQRAIVLVHGAWAGEWCWWPMLPYLAASGRPVYPVSLTGHGARRHQGGPHVTLDDHVADVLGVLDTFDLDEVTLVGHSYGGRVITPVIAHAARRLAAVVYLDAHAPVAPDPGQSAERRATAEAHGGMVPFEGYDRDVELLGSPEAQAWFLDRIVDHSFACFTGQWWYDLPAGLRRTYVHATDVPGSTFAGYAAACAASPEWTYHELHGPHFLMLSHPSEIADIVLSA